MESNGEGTEKERTRNGKGTLDPDQKKEREWNAFLKIGKGTGTERVPHFIEISNALNFGNKCIQNLPDNRKTA